MALVHITTAWTYESRPSPGTPGPLHTRPPPVGKHARSYSWDERLHLSKYDHLLHREALGKDPRRPALLDQSIFLRKAPPANPEMSNNISTPLSAPGDLDYPPEFLARKYHATHEDDAQYRALFQASYCDIISILQQDWDNVYGLGLMTRAAHGKQGSGVVLVVTGEVSGPSWRTIELAIRQILESHDMLSGRQIPIDLAHSRVVLASRYPSPIDAAFGVSMLPWSSATHGGYVRLRSTDVLNIEDSRSSWITKIYSLTCHHAARPTRTISASGLNTGYDATLDSIGNFHPAITPGSPQNAHLSFQSPDATAVQKNRVIRSQQRSIIIERLNNIQPKIDASGENPQAADRYSDVQSRLQNKLAELDAVEAQPIEFGILFASSGYKVDSNVVPGYLHGCTLDWCLLEVRPERVGTNEIPELLNVPADFDDLNGTWPRPRIVSTAPLRPGLVCKVGKRSGITYGRVSADKFALFNLDTNGGQPSIDTIVTTEAFSAPFSQPGDSGAWVFDTEGRVVGLVIGYASGFKAHRSGHGSSERDSDVMETWHYITPIDAIFRDIESVTGCIPSLQLFDDEEGRMAGYWD